MEGESRECVGGHEVICSLFPRLSSPHAGHTPLKMVYVVPSQTSPDEAPEQHPLRLGVVLSGGQAPGAKGRAAATLCPAQAEHRHMVAHVVQPFSSRL